MLNAVPFLKHQFPENRFNGFGGPGFVLLFQGVQGVVAVGVDDIRGSEVLSVLGEPVAERGGVCVVQVAPEDEAVAAFGVRARDGEDVVDPSAGFDAQADEGVEGFGQVDVDFAARAVAHGGEGVGEGVGEVFAQQAGAAGCFFAKGVAQTVILGQGGISGQQVLLCGIRRRQFEAVQRVLVGFQSDVFEELRNALARDRLAVFPVR